MRAFHLPAAALLCALLVAPAGAAGITNGNFEDGPAIGSEAIHAVGVGDPALTGWTVTQSVVVIVTDSYWVPLSQHRSLCLSDMRSLSQNTVPGVIQQTFASAAGATYRLIFWMSGEPFSSPTIKHLRVNAGSVQQDFTFDVTPAWEWDMAWQQHTVDFTASSSTTTVRLASQDISTWGPAIDSLSIALVSTGVPAGSAMEFGRVSPDPVRDGANLSFTLATAGNARLAIYDVQGRARATLADGTYGAGPHTVAFNPRQSGLPPGLYLAVLQAAGETRVRRFTVLD